MRSLWECHRAIVVGERIICGTGRALLKDTVDGGISLLKAARGEPLIITTCQKCTGFVSNGEPLPVNLRGWTPEALRRKVE